ncbi:MAG: hypothetical protein J2P37_11425 [Ktedonobacteraceae bacterium]|nr:hypothetical protein [Ktedonobacteraceae bacterium]
MSDDQLTGLAAFMTAFGLIISLISLVALIIGIIAWWKIFSKAGFSGALCLLFFIPIANIIVFLYLAFAEWPVHRELNYLRSQMGARGQQYPSYPQGRPY